MPRRKLVAAGNRYTLGGFIDENGFFIGSSPTPPANGSTSPAFQIEGIKEASPTIPEGDVVGVTGEDGLIAEFEFDPTGNRRYIINYAVENMLILARIMNVNIETIAGADSVVLDIDEMPEYNLCFLHQSRAKAQDDGVKGQAAWDAQLVNLCSARPLGRQAFSERTAANFRMSITPQLASYSPWGVTIAASAGANAARYRKLQPDYPFMLEAYTGDGTANPIVLSKTPASVSRFGIWANRVLVGVSSINTSTPSVTPSSSIATGARTILFYQFIP
jgi:hypothetical protein